MVPCIYPAAGSTERRLKTEVDLPPVPSLDIERLRQLATLQEHRFQIVHSADRTADRTPSRGLEQRLHQMVRAPAAATAK